MFQEKNFILGIDYGIAKIGLAKADKETHLAFPLKVIANDKNFFEKLKDLVACEGIETIVIGYSQHFKNKFNPIEVEKIGKKISDMTQCSVFFEEEMFTTRMAGQNIKSRPDYSKNKAEDAEAARLILESWISKNLEKNDTFR